MSSDSDPPSLPPLSTEDSEPITGIHNVPKPQRAWATSVSRRVRRLEKHFEPEGMVGELHSDWSAVKKGVGFFKWVAPMLASVVVAVIVGIIWLVQHAATQPPPPNAQDIARELAKHQAQQK